MFFKYHEKLLHCSRVRRSKRLEMSPKPRCEKTKAHKRKTPYIVPQHSSGMSDTNSTNEKRLNCKTFSSINGARQVFGTIKQGQPGTKSEAALDHVWFWEIIRSNLSALKLYKIKKSKNMPSSLKSKNFNKKCFISFYFSQVIVDRCAFFKKEEIIKPNKKRKFWRHLEMEGKLWT